MYSRNVFYCDVQTWTQPLGCSSNTTLVCPLMTYCSYAFACQVPLSLCQSMATALLTVQQQVEESLTWTYVLFAS